MPISIEPFLYFIRKCMRLLPWKHFLPDLISIELELRGHVKLKDIWAIRLLRKIHHRGEDKVIELGGLNSFLRHPGSIYGCI